MAGRPRGGCGKACLTGTLEQMIASPLIERLRHLIDSEGPLTFAAFMEIALYDPKNGFYSRPAVGEAGDFVTSPHVSPVFGDLLAHQLEDFWHLLERPQEFAVIEVGAGSGTLAGQILGSLPSELARRTSYFAVERSAAARESNHRQTDEAGGRVAAVGGLDEIPSGRIGCVLANELLDNLPFHRLRGTDHGNVELFVDVDPGSDHAFILREGPVSSAEIEGLLPALAPGEEAAASPEALRFVEQASGVLDRGYVWLFDYGWNAGGASRARSDLVHGYRRHRIEEDVLADPGSRDITSGVDFGALVRHAMALGLHVWGPVTQRETLLALGYPDWDQQARARQVQATTARHGVDALRIYSDRNRAALLVDPAGLGQFLVLCLGVEVSGERVPRSFRTRRP